MFCMYKRLLVSCETRSDEHSWPLLPQNLSGMGTGDTALPGPLLPRGDHCPEFIHHALSLPRKGFQLPAPGRDPLANCTFGTLNYVLLSQGGFGELASPAPVPPGAALCATVQLGARFALSLQRMP